VLRKVVKPAAGAPRAGFFHDFQILAGDLEGRVTAVTECDGVSAVRAGSWALAALPDEIDMANAGRVEQALRRELAEGVRVLVIDMGATTFCDSLGLGALVQIWKRAQANGVEIRIVVPPGRVRRLMAVTRVDQVLPLYWSMGEALAGAPGPLRAHSGDDQP
jgi:anti-sigma B factor antagonist